jgi:lipoprotein-releasing system permease protein
VANSDIDENLALGELHATQRLLNYDGRLSGIAISLTESANVERVSRAIESLAGEGFTARSREQKNASMNHILRMERFAIVLIGAMIALVATLSVVGSVIMLITDKRRDIATLRAMGANRRLIHQIFVGEGMLLCSVGCLAGIILGLALCLGQQYFGWVRIPGASSIVEFYPVSIELIDSLTIALIVLLLGWAITASTVRITLRKL